MPWEALKNYFQERLQLLKIQKKREEGIDFTDKEQKRFNASARMKVHILKKIIFPAMTNLIYFFERMYENPELRELFEDDLIDLLDSSGQIPIQARKHPQISGISIRETMFTRLVMSSILLNTKDSIALKDTTNFRRKLAQDIQSIIYAKMKEILDSDYGRWTSNQLKKSVSEDIARALNWVLFTTKEVEYKEEKPEKILGFIKPKALSRIYRF